MGVQKELNKVRGIFVAVNKTPIFIYGEEEVREVRRGSEIARERELKFYKDSFPPLEVPAITYNSIKGSFKAAHRSYFVRNVVAKYFGVDPHLEEREIFAQISKKLEKQEVQGLKFTPDEFRLFMVFIDLRPPFVGYLPDDIIEFIKEDPYLSTFGTGLGKAGKSKFIFTNAYPLVDREDYTKWYVIKKRMEKYLKLCEVFPELPKPKYVDKFFEKVIQRRDPIELPKEEKEKVDSLFKQLLGAEFEKAPITKPVIWTLEICNVIELPFVSTLTQQTSVVYNDNIGALIIAFRELSKLTRIQNRWIFAMMIEIEKQYKNQKHVIYMFKDMDTEEFKFKCVKIEKNHETEDNSLLKMYIDAYENYIRNVPEILIKYKEIAKRVFSK